MAAAAVRRPAPAGHWPPPVDHVVLDLDIAASTYGEAEVPKLASWEGQRPAAPPAPSGPKIPEIIVAPKVPDPLERQIGGDVRRFVEMPQQGGRAPCIWRVHPSLREQEREAYEPRILSIGPLHRHNESLRPMEEIKLRYLYDLLRRSPAEDTLSNYIRVVRDGEQRAREQYAEDTVGMNRDEFVRMLIVDGCFIIEYLLKMVAKETQLLQLSGARLCSSYMRRDLMLLENQIPFFVLVELFRQSSAVAAVDHPGPHLVEICLEFLAVELPEGVELPVGDVRHLLHLYHMCLNPKRMPDDPPPGYSCGRALCQPVKLARRLISAALFGLLYLLLLRKCPISCSAAAATTTAAEDGDAPAAIPCATELQQAGVRFRKRKGAGCCFLKVRFTTEGMLQIPLLSVNESTGSLFRNLIALEQSCPHIVGGHMTAYAILLDNLVNTAGDVGILRERGIIESKLGSDKDVAKMINTLCNGTHLMYKGGGDGLYADLFRDVRRYCAVPHHKWRASLKQTYFTSPWTAISLLVAILLFCVAVTQVYLNLRRQMRK